MSQINRGLMLVTPKAPHLQWIKSIFPEFDGDPGERTGYLVPEIEMPEDEERIVEQVWPIVFEYELESWDRDEACWPSPRTLDLFREHFDLEFSSIVEDLCGWEIERETIEDD